MLSLREPAEQAGTSKSTIFRAIKAGRLSAARTDDGGFAIDPAELYRVYPPKSAADAPQRAEQRSAGQDATAPEAAHATAATDELVAMLRASLADMRNERDNWREMAQRLALSAPITPPPPPPVATPAPAAPPAPERRPWWRRIAG